MALKHHRRYLVIQRVNENHQLMKRVAQEGDHLERILMIELKFEIKNLFYRKVLCVEMNQFLAKFEAKMKWLILIYVEMFYYQV